MKNVQKKRMKNKTPFIYSATYEKDIERQNEYPFNIPIIKALKKLEFHENVTFIIGENGSGKSTLLEALAIKMGFNPEGGTKNFNFSTRESHSELFKYLRIHKHHIPPENHFFLRAESYFNVATKIEIEDKEVYEFYVPPIINSYGGKSLHEQSHGESFFSLFLNRFGENGLYILDEPEAALSPNRQMAMLARIDQLIKQNCQFIIATHSPILLSYPNALIYELRDGKIEKVKYEESELFITTKYFINNYQKMHKELF